MSKRGASATPEKKKAKATTTLNFNKAVDKAHESSSLRELVDAPVSAIEGVGPKTEEMLVSMHIKTISQLAHWKFYRAAKAIVTLAALEEAGGRADDAKSNIDQILDKEFESKTFKEIAAAPVSALQGLAEWVDKALAPAHIKTIADLAAWKHAATAEAIVALAEFEK